MNEEQQLVKDYKQFSWDLSKLVNYNMTEAESEIKWGCTSMKILFSAAMNFKMINKIRSVDSRGSLEYSRADKVMNK